MYDLKIFAKNGKLVYVVYVSCPIKIGVFFFKSADELFAWAEEERKIYKRYGFEFELIELNWDRVEALIEEVLFNEHIHIGEYGKTFYE
nr:MAG TPA: hypothetical protein [Caudoviricetes sp.]